MSILGEGAGSDRVGRRGRVDRDQTRCTAVGSGRARPSTIVTIDTFALAV